MFVTLALLALAVEVLVGYPHRLYALIGHPVSWIGALIARLDRSLNRAADGLVLRRARGLAALLVVLAITCAGAVGISVLIAALPGWIAVGLEAVAASTLLASRSLDSHVAAVAQALERGGLESGRDAVSRIVGRDPAALDEAGVSRAAIESLAENFSDGVVAPMLWLAIAGLPGAALYKAINTADSMIGHMSERYLAFGWVAARLDDVVNLPASRLAALLVVLAAVVVPGASPAGAWGAVWRDASRHRSPNAGWPEAAMAGALGLRLAGPRTYDGEVVDDHWMGDGRAAASGADIRRALIVYRVAVAEQLVALALLAAGFHLALRG